MLKPKLSISTLICLVKIIKKNIYWTKFKNTSSRDDFKKIRKDHIFDNLIAIVALFWLLRQKDIVCEKIDLKKINLFHNKIPAEIIDTIQELFSFSITTKKKSNDYLSSKEVYLNKASEITQRLTSILKKDCEKMDEQLSFWTKCIEALINFNFIDLYTIRLKVLEANEDQQKYDTLIHLIELQMNYLDHSYAMFREVNSVNFNLIFKIIVSLRKSLI